MTLHHTKPKNLQLVEIYKKCCIVQNRKLPFSIQSCRSCYATLHLCQRPFYKIFVKFRNSKIKNDL